MGAIREWYLNLPDQWRAALRSAWQSVVGTFLAFLLGLLALAADVVGGGTLDDALTGTANLAKIAILAIIGILSGLVSFGMNRPGAKNAATYDHP